MKYWQAWMACGLLMSLPAAAQADIFQWEYVNPADPGQGKQQSMVLTPDGAGVDAEPGENLLYRNLTMAYLIGKDLQNALAAEVNLTNADLSQANLTNANLGFATLTGADFTDAQVQGASFYRDSYYAGTGLTLAQLYSTASYQAHDLTGIHLGGNNLSGGNFAGQNLTNAVLNRATLTGADFTGAQVQGANFEDTGLTLAQLYSTASYQAHDLTGIGLYRNDLSGGNFAGQNLTNAYFVVVTLTGADFTDAQVRGANFYSGTNHGFTKEQLYSTASYQAHDLTGIGLSYNNLSGFNFAGQNLTNANFYFAMLTGANLSQANLTNADLGIATLSGANLSQANLTSASLDGATLTGADFTGAQVQGARFGIDPNYGGTGLTLSQLYSTASYQAHDLTGIGLGGNNLSGGNFAGQNLTNANFESATLTDANFSQANLTNADLYVAALTGADFTDAQVQGANFGRFYIFNETGLTLAQLYSTASYQAHDLTGIGLGGSNLSGGNFAGQNLTNADFSVAALTGADFTGAQVQGANFDYTTYFGFTKEQLYSTASYQAHDLTGIGLRSNNLSGGNFAGQNLTNAVLNGATLTGADFTGAQVQGAQFNLLCHDFGCSDTGLTLAQLYSTASYQAHDLTGIGLYRYDLSGGNFAGQNLTNANFLFTLLTVADFTGAQVQGADFGYTGLTLGQLYSTASYQAHDLTGIGLGQNNLSGGNFAGQNLTNADFYDATLTGANLTGADTRGAYYLSLPGNEITTNLIRPYGQIAGLDLGGGQQLVVRDYDGNPNYGIGPHAIHVDSHFLMAPGGVLQLVFEADAWDSLISFAPGIDVSLGGTLELLFAPDVSVASQVGRTIDLFDWAGVARTGAFAVDSPYSWDLSKLYTTGEVTLTAVPEPSTLVLLMFAAAGCCLRRRRLRFVDADERQFLFCRSAGGPDG